MESRRRPRLIKISIIGRPEIAEQLNLCYMDHVTEFHLGYLQLNNKLIAINIFPIKYLFNTSELLGGTSSIIWVYNSSDKESFDILKPEMEETIPLKQHLKQILVGIKMGDAVSSKGFQKTAEDYAKKHKIGFSEIELNDEHNIRILFSTLVQEIWEKESHEAEEIKIDISDKHFEVTEDFITRIVEKEFSEETILQFIKQRFFIKEDVLFYLRQLRASCFSSKLIIDKLLELNQETHGLEEFFAVKRPYARHFFNRKEGNTTHQFKEFIKDWKKDLPALIKQYCAELIGKKSIAQQIKELKLKPDEEKLFKSFRDPITNEYINIPVTLKVSSSRKAPSQVKDFMPGSHPPLPPKAFRVGPIELVPPLKDAKTIKYFDLETLLKTQHCPRDIVLATLLIHQFDTVYEKCLRLREEEGDKIQRLLRKNVDILFTNQFKEFQAAQDQSYGESEARPPSRPPSP